MRVEIEKPRAKCYECMRPKSSCMCKYTSPINSKSRFIILMHPMEYRKEKNGTGHITNLQMENCEIIVGINFNDNPRVNQILSESGSRSFLLYPGSESVNLSTLPRDKFEESIGHGSNFFILDATWACAKKMLKCSKNIQGIERISFDNKIKSKFIIKQQPDSLCLSTIESVFTVLNLLKENGLESYNTDGFLFPFEKMIEYQVECILNPDNENHYSNKKECGVISKKNMYRKTTQRNIIFEN